MDIVQLFDKKLRLKDNYTITENDLASLMGSGLSRDEINFLIHRALYDKKIQPNIVLVISPQIWPDRDCLVPFSMALKFGADANDYVQQQGTSPIHIVGYLARFLRVDQKFDSANNSLLTDLFILLMLSGGDLYSTYNQPSKFPNNNRNLPKLYEVLENKNILSSFLDDPDDIGKMLSDEKYDPYRLMLDKTINTSDINQQLNIARSCIKYFSPGIFKLLSLNDQEAMIALSETIRRFNDIAYFDMLERGYIPDYSMINEMLIDIKKTGGQGDYYTAQVLEDMVLKAVDYGAELDQYQMNFAASFNPGFARLLNQSYKKSYGERICQTELGPAPRELKVLAVGLNMKDYQSKKDICPMIKMALATKKEDYVDGSRKLQRERFKTEISIPADQIVSPGKEDTATQDIESSSKDFSPDNPYDYNNLSISIYRDGNRRVWFFDSSRYYDILYEDGKLRERYINPENGEPLPSYFVDTVKAKFQQLRNLGFAPPYGRESLERMGLDPTVPQAYDRLISPRRLGVDNTDEEKTFYQYAKDFGIDSETLLFLSAKDLQNILRSVVNNRVDLEDLAGNRAYMINTLSKQVNRLTPERRKDFFQEVKRTILSKIRDLPQRKTVNPTRERLINLSTNTSDNNSNFTITRDLV